MNSSSYLLRSVMLMAFAVTALVSCDDNATDSDPDPETPHPYESMIRDNGEIVYGSIDGDVTWTNDTVYYLDGYVYVESGTLTIEPGTVILSFEEPSSVAVGNATSLIVTRDAEIDAQGTANNPIIFTSALDGEPFGESLLLNQTNSKLWAGIILLGNAPAYSGGNTDMIQIEGIIDPDERSQYGGSDVNDSSGIMRYVSIRFTGAEIGPGNEIQGLTLGGVGAGTTLEYIDIFVSADDGIEIFGGTVDIRNISVAFAEDDSFDLDLGWSGTGQYLFSLQGGNGADHGGEWDGASPDNAPLYSKARLSNVTMIGQGLNSSARSSSAPAIGMFDGAAFSLYNSIVTDFNGLGIGIEDRNEAEDVYDKIINNVNSDNAAISGNVWFTGNANSIASMIAVTSGTPRDATGATIATYLTTNGNTFGDPGLNGISRTKGSAGLDPRPTAGAATAGAVNVSSDLTQTTYKGAFDPTATPWIADWTTLARYGYLADF